MEYPSKHTAPLRVIYNLKLNPCEHLETSVQDVIKNTQKLMSEMASDRNKFLNLINIAEQLDSKCENLQKEMEEMAVERESGRIKIKNALQATENLIGKQESLAPVELIVNGDRVNSTLFSDIQEPDHNSSLLEELSDQYRVLIEKYKTLVDEKENESHLQRLIHPYSDNMSGQSGPSMNQNVSDVTRNSNFPLYCQRCSTCTCRLPLSQSRTKSNKAEKFSQIETSIEWENGLNCKYTQTESNYEMLT